MNLLFDTHAFIWWDSKPAKLSARVLTLCHDTTNVLFLSVASVWEMQIKQQLGKLKLNLLTLRSRPNGGSKFNVQCSKLAVPEGRSAGSDRARSPELQHFPPRR
jgi:PIN domain nuclease of toxin-antitoxin system